MQVNRDTDEDRMAQEAIRSRANRSISVLEKAMYQKFGCWPNLVPAEPKQ
jgi:hypothetical protein